MINITPTALHRKEILERSNIYRTSEIFSYICNQIVLDIGMCDLRSALSMVEKVEEQLSQITN